jgi:aconitate hydratase
VLMFRSNVPAIAEFCFRNVDPEFVARARAAGGGVIVGGEIYGQGSSREAAVLSPLHLGVRAVLAKSFARIHRANLINWGIAPLEFENPADADAIERDDVLDFEGLRESLAAGTAIAVVNRRTGARFRMRSILSPRERDMLLAGGLLTQTAAGRAEAAGEASGSNSRPERERG